MQLKMAAPHGVWLGFFVLVLCLGHGSWSVSARSVDLMLSQSKKELGEESHQAAYEPLPPEVLSDPGSINENNNEPLEVVQGSPSPTSLGDSDQSACGWNPCGHAAGPNCNWHGCARPPVLRPCCGYPSHGSSVCPPYRACYPPQLIPECQPASQCHSFYPPEPSPDCQPPYPGPYPFPGCQPADQPIHGCVNPGCVYPPHLDPGYAPQPNPGCLNPGCAYPPQSESGYAPEPNPEYLNPDCGCQWSGYPNPGCLNPGVSSPCPGPVCFPQPNPECLNPNPGCVNPGCAYPPYPGPACLPQPNTGCLNPDCQPYPGSGYPPQPNPWCNNPECQPYSGSGYPPQPNPWCLNPGCLPLPAYTPQLEPNHPALPEPFFPPQHEIDDPSPGSGPRMNEENSQRQQNNGSMQSNEVETAPTEQDRSDIISPSTT